MAEIFLSFFAVIGMLFLIIYICDYFFYRNFDQTLVLTIDTRLITFEKCIDAFELIISVRKTTIGKAAIGSILVLVNGAAEEKIKLAREYMRIFNIPGKIQTIDEA